MNSELALKHCRIIAPEKLSDRFISSGAYFQKDTNDLKSQVFLAYVFEVGHSWFPSSKVLPTILQILEDAHPKMKPGDTLGDQFEGLLKTINEQLNVISEDGETDWIGNLNGLILVMSGTELHFSQTGRCPAYLLQKNRIRQITDDANSDKEPHPLKTFFNIASGVVGLGDYILVSNMELYNEISLDALRRVMNDSSPAEACQAIVKELKREKNLGVSSVILQATTMEKVTESDEITEIFLEEEMQSTFKKLKKKLTPVAIATAETSVKLGKASYRVAKKTAIATHKVVTPAAKTLIQKGASAAGNAAKKRQKAVSVVEIISPRIKKEVVSPAPIPVKPLQAINRLPRPSFSNPIPKIKDWSKKASNKKIAALALAVLLIGITGIAAYLHHSPAKEPGTLSQNEKTLQTAKDLQEKATTAVKLKQNIEASREIRDAQTAINSLSGLTTGQKKQAETIWSSLKSLTAEFVPTTHLASASATYGFGGPVQKMISNLPYFYGFADASPLLQRSGKGESGVVQGSVSLPDSSDSIVSIAKSLEADTAGYILTRNNKVFRITQDGVPTNLRAISPSEGNFAPGDAINVYNGSIYILDGKTGLLWRYRTSGTVYEKGESIIDSTKYDIKKTVSLAIDGSIYVLKQDGSVLKFTSGTQEDFKLKGQPELLKDLLQPLKIITNSDMDNIYVLDGGVSTGSHSTAKVLEFKKNGEFVRQYTFPDNLSQVLNFDIDPLAKKLWLLSNDTVSEFDL